MVILDQNKKIPKMLLLTR